MTEAIKIDVATREDLSEILKLQKTCYKEVGERYNTTDIPPLAQSYESILQDYAKNLFLKLKINDSIIGSVRAFEKNNICYIGRLIVHPEYQNKGYGKQLLKTIEQPFNSCSVYELFTGHKDEKNLGLYQHMGYSRIKTETITENQSLIYLQKRN